MTKCGPMGLERKTSIQARLLTQTAGLILGLSQNPLQQLCWVFYCQRKGECIEKFRFFSQVYVRGPYCRKSSGSRNTCSTIHIDRTTNTHDIAIASRTAILPEDLLERHLLKCIGLFSPGNYVLYMVRTW